MEEMYRMHVTHVTHTDTFDVCMGSLIRFRPHTTSPLFAPNCVPIHKSATCGQERNITDSLHESSLSTNT